MNQKEFQTRKEHRTAKRRARRAEMKRRAAKQQRRNRARRWLFVIGTAAVILAVIWVIVPSLSMFSSDSSSGISGPKGDPNIAQDIGTLVGQPAPSFTLADAEGQDFTVTPSDGNLVVLIFHMGLT